MGSLSDVEIDDLLELASEGDRWVIQRLFDRYRGRLERMVRLRIDPRLARRLDPADVVQDTMLLATRRFDDYLERRPLPFYLWLRRMALDRMIQLHRQHVLGQKRTLKREYLSLPDQSATHLVNRLVASDTSPSGRVTQRERRDRVRASLAELSDHDHEILVLLYMEQLSTADVSAVLEITTASVRQRHSRALRRLHQLLGDMHQ